MAINVQYNLKITSLLYLAFTNACSSALSKLANIPQKIREMGANLYNRMYPSTPVQIELPNTEEFPKAALEGNPESLLREVYKPSDSVTNEKGTELDVEETEYNVDIIPPSAEQESLLPTEEEEEALALSAPRSVKLPNTSAKSPKTTFENLIDARTIYGGNKEVVRYSYLNPEQFDGASNLRRGSFEIRRHFQ